MTETEKLIEIVTKISINRKVGLFEAIFIFSDENMIEMEDIIPIIDSSLIEKVKADALNTNIVCNRKLFEVKTTNLF